LSVGFGAPAVPELVAAVSNAGTFGVLGAVYNTLYDVWWPDASHRTLRNKTLEEWDAAGCPPSGSRTGEGTSIGRRRLSNGEWTEMPRYAMGTVPSDFDGDVDYAPLWAGESCGFVNDIKPASEIVRDLVRDAEAALRIEHLGKSPQSEGRS
jgi:nitronate monooxygenase